MRLSTILQRLHPALAERQGQAGREDHRTAWEQTLAATDGTLHTLAGSSEGGFLALGEKLQDFYGRAKDLSGSATAVMHQMTSQDLAQAIEDLQVLLQDLQSLVDQTQAQFAEIGHVFDRYRGTLQRVLSALEDFDLLVLNLNMLGFLTRVENAHVYTDQSGFASLTDDVKRLSESMRQKATHIRAEARQIQAFLKAATADIVTIEQAQGAHAHAMLKETMANHRRLTEKYASASQSARNIAAQSTQMADNIAEIVQSLQFHDITRQQIEHVRTVLQALAEQVRTRSEEQQAGLMRDIGTLQIAQLNQADDQLVRAVQSVSTNLLAIAAGVGAILETANAMGWTAGTHATSFMGGVDEGIAAIIQALQDTAQEQARLQTTVDQVGTMVAKMSGFIEEIERLGFQLQLIALNARIKATHLGRDGAALDTISGSIYQQSQAAREDTHRLTDIIDTIVGLARESGVEFQAMREAREAHCGQTIGRLEELLAAIRQVNGTVQRLHAELTASGSTLQADIAQCAQGIAVHTDMHAALDAVIAQLAAVTEQARRQNPQGQADISATFLDDIDRLYTMHSERAVHMQLNEQAHPPQTTPSQTTADDLGDNVELF